MGPPTRKVSTAHVVGNFANRHVRGSPLFSLSLSLTLTLLQCCPMAPALHCLSSNHPLCLSDVDGRAQDSDFLNNSPASAAPPPTWSRNSPVHHVADTMNGSLPNHVKNHHANGCDTPPDAGLQSSNHCELPCVDHPVAGLLVYPDVPPPPPPRSSRALTERAARVFAQTNEPFPSGGMRSGRRRYL